MKQKVLLLQGTLSLYNVPIYNIIGTNVDLTVAYVLKNECKDKMNFQVLKLDFCKVSGIIFIKNGFYDLCSQYDVIIFMPDLHYFSYCSLPFIKRKFKVIPWTIGIRASYNRRYDVSRRVEFLDKIYGHILNKSDAIIFYMKEPLKFWSNRLNRDKVFIAHNTVEVLKTITENKNQKNRIIFLGTLYKEKKIYELLEAYIEAKKRSQTKFFLGLDIIGNGEEYDNINKIIADCGLTDSVVLHGSVYDEIKLSEFFSKSLLCISPDQAGLSVLKSMGYGVPYVTRENAITGGERLNIINKENGILYKSKAELVSIIEEASINPEIYINMGINAQKYYNENATVKHMAQGFIDAINFVLH